MKKIIKTINMPSLSKNILSQLKADLQKLQNPRYAKILARFFKTGQGEYGQGNKFLGIKTPLLRKTAKKYNALKLSDLQKLLNNKIHEYRSTALIILINKYAQAQENERKQIIDFYLKNTLNINNWDLVDLSAPKILGDWLLKCNRSILYKLAKSKNLWEKRIAILSTFAFIKNNQFADTLKIIKILLSDQHDLIHKACGWMLREIGKRNQKIEESFLQTHYRLMPKIMLRYALEKFDMEKQKKYIHC